MLRHYFKISWRNLLRQKGLSAINILGLSIGLACFMLFLLYAVNEFSFDRFHENSKNIYRVYRWQHAINEQEAGGDTYMPMPLGPAMKAEFPEVEQYVRFKESWGESFIQTDKEVLKMDIVFADPSFFNVFSFPLLSGDPKNALSDPRNIVITEKVAERLFKNEEPRGKIIRIKVDSEYESFQVAAVAKNPPVNSTIQFNILGSFAFYESSEGGQWAKDSWTRAAFQTFVQLKNGNSISEKAMMGFWRKYYSDSEKELRDKGQWKGEGSPTIFRLQPLTGMHTATNIFGGLVEGVNPKNVWILLSIATGLLLIACINFTTLSIGRSAGRAKEVGIRKVIGSNKREILIQFFTEAFLLTLISVVLGYLLSQLLLPYFRTLSGRDLVFDFSNYPEMIWLILILIVLVALIAGSYPALVLSRFKPLEVFKSKWKVGGSNLFTKSLVTFQFVLSIGLIICMIVMMKQLNFLRDKNPGFNKENVLVVDAQGLDTKKIYPLFRNELVQDPSILGIASTDIGIGEGTGWSRSDFEYEGKQKGIFEYYVDNDYIKVMGLQLLAGRNFDSNITADTVRSIIVNESLVQDFGWTVQEAIGKELKGYNETKTPIIIGVVKNFNYRPFSEEVKPQMFHQFAAYQPYKFFVRAKQGKHSEALAAVNQAWKKVAGQFPFKYSFLDEDIDRFYKNEKKWSSIIGWAGGVSIFLACLGLFGLASLAAVNRVKEIGIRKVLGASITNIVQLLSSDFLKLVGIAFLIASPLAWYFMNNWLEDFAYRISIGWTVFLVAGIASVVVALITVSFQAVKAAIANPVKNLRTE